MVCLGLKKIVSVHRAPYLLRDRAFEAQEYVGRPGALHIRHPANAYSSVGDHIFTISTPVNGYKKSTPIMKTQHIINS
jgi:hypothetical protein